VVVTSLRNQRRIGDIIGRDTLVKHDIAAIIADIRTGRDPSTIRSTNFANGLYQPETSRGIPITGFVVAGV
jgi:hypothetical protein